MKNFTKMMLAVALLGGAATIYMKMEAKGTPTTYLPGTCGESCTTVCSVGGKVPINPGSTATNQGVIAGCSCVCKQSSAS